MNEFARWNLLHFISGPGSQVNFDPASRIPGPINVDNVVEMNAFYNQATVA